MYILSSWAAMFLDIMLRVRRRIMLNLFLAGAIDSLRGNRFMRGKLVCPLRVRLLNKVRQANLAFFLG